MAAPILAPVRDPYLGADGRPARHYRLHRVQAEVVTGPERFKVLVAGRRSGKSYCAVVWCLNQGQAAALRGMRGVIWIVYPTLDVSKTAWRKFMSLTPRGWITKVDGTEQHPHAITMGDITYEFKTAVSGGRLVGEGLLALWIDECGLIPGDVYHESLRPTLIDHRAPALFTGTPKGENWFYEMFVRGLDPAQPAYRTWSEGPKRGVSTYSNPEVPPEEIEEMTREYPELLLRQELMAEFIAGTGYFRNVMQNVATDEEAATLDFQLTHDGCSTRKTAAIGVDLARTRDFTVIVGMDSGGWVTYFDRFREIDWPIQKRRIMVAWERLGRPALVVDATGVGDPVTQDLKYQGARVEGFQFTSRSKVPLFEALAMAFDERRVRLPAARHPLLAVAMHELAIFQATHTPAGHMQLSAPEGKHDDICCALALALKGAMRFGDVGITF